MYDSPEELLNRIRLGEDTTLELKAVHLRGDRVAAPHREALADEIAAIANTADGVIVLGVDDTTRDISGIPVDRLEAVERLVYEICNQSIDPPVFYRAYRMELPDETGTLRPVLKLDVPRSLFVHRSPGGYFRRQGSSRREMPPEALARLFQQRSQARLIRFDEQAVPNTSLDDLAEPLWRRFVRDTAGDVRTILQKLSILRVDDAGVLRATVAGILMCATRPELSLKNASITCVRYRGRTPDANYQQDAQEITGPLDQQVVDAFAFVRRNMSVAALKAPARADLPQYDERAVFEALVNTVAHRDYSVTGSRIRLFMFDDRLELYSPGPLPNTLTVDSIALRQSTRNELIASLLAKCPAPDQAERSFMMDKRGEGVPIILNNSERLSGRKPDYRLVDDAELVLTIWAAQPPASDDAAPDDHAAEDPTPDAPTNPDAPTGVDAAQATTAQATTAQDDTTPRSRGGQSDTDAPDPGHARWLAALYQLVENGDTQRAADRIFERIDGLLERRAFADCDDLLNIVDVGRLDTFSLVSFLAASLAGAAELPSRPDLYRRTERRLRELAPDRADRLLAGLRGTTAGTTAG